MTKKILEALDLIGGAFAATSDYLDNITCIVQDELIKFRPPAGFVLSAEEEEFEDILKEILTILRFSALVHHDAPKAKERTLLYINRELYWDNFIHNDHEDLGTEEWGKPWSVGDMFYCKLDWILEGSNVVDSNTIRLIQDVLPGYLNAMEELLKLFYL